MNMRLLRRLITTLLLSGALAIACGCAKTGMTAKESGTDDGSGATVIQTITASKDGTSVEIIADKPLTYTYYKVPDQLKAVIDLAQAEPGKNSPVQEVNVGNIRRIEITRHSFGAGFLSRLEIVMAKDIEFTINPDAVDKKKLVISFASSAQTAEQTKPVVEKEATEQAKPAVEKSAAEPASDKAPVADKPATAENVPVVAETPPPAAASVPEVAKNDAPVNEATGGGDKRSAAEPVAEEKPAIKSDATDQPVAGKTLTAIAVVNDGIEIQVAGGVETYNSFTLSKPERLVIDLVNAKNSITSRSITLNSFGLSKARLGKNQNKVRIVFDAAKAKFPTYQVATTASGLKVTFSDAPPAETVSAEKASPATVAEETPSRKRSKQKPLVAEPAVKAKAGLLEMIEFKQEKGESRVVMKLSGDCTYNKPAKGSEGLLLTLKNCQVPRKFQRVLDTGAFPSVVTSVTPYQVRAKRGTDARILVKLQSETTNNLQRDGDVLVWSFKNPDGTQPVLISEAPKAQNLSSATQIEKAAPAGTDISLAERVTDKAAKKAYSGKKISLDFSDADVRQIFRLLEDVSQVNFLIPDEVAGKLTIKLVNVPWDQALDVILETKNLDMRREGNIVQILPKEKKVKMDQEEVNEKKRAEEKLEMKTEIFDVNYSTPDDIKKQFNSIKSDKGRIETDARTNKIIVFDNELRLKDMKELMAKLDIPEKQVMIEARIVEASSSFTRDLGVQWGIHYKDGSASMMGINAIDTGLGGVVSPPPGSGFPDSKGSGGAVGLSFGKLTSNIQLDLRLSAASTTGLIKIISTPKVVTLNNKPAKIAQGQSIPYQTTSAEGTKTEFIEAALTLDVTPHITADGSISMKIKATNNTPGTGSPPPINKKEATTELQVKNGETTVIGGIYVDSDTEENKGVPFLSDIPLLGWLFKSNTKTKSKSELLIFITPKILN